MVEVHAITYWSISRPRVNIGEGFDWSYLPCPSMTSHRPYHPAQCLHSRRSLLLAMQCAPTRSLPWDSAFCPCLDHQNTLLVCSLLQITDQKASLCSFSFLISAFFLFLYPVYLALWVLVWQERLGFHPEWGWAFCFLASIDFWALTIELEGFSYVWSFVLDVAEDWEEAEEAACLAVCALRCLIFLIPQSALVLWYLLLQGSH